MIIVEPGHKYGLESFEDKDVIRFITFVKKDIKGDPTNRDTTHLETVHDGTTNEEVLKMMVDRMHYLNGKMPCRENSIVVTKLEEALLWLEKRTQDRIERGAEGKREM